MKYTKSYKMNLPESSDMIDITKLNSNFTALDSLISGLSQTVSAIQLKLNTLAENAFDLTYGKLLVNSDSYDVCSDFLQHTISYADWQADGNGSGSAVYKVTDKNIMPDTSASIVFFVSFTNSNDDEVNNHQALIYPNGDIYVRTRCLWYYQGGTAQNPTFNDWSLDSSFIVHAQNYFKSVI